MSRLYVGALLLLSSLLLLEGSGGMRPEAASNALENGTLELAGRDANPARGPLSASDVASMLGRANPELSQKERDQIGTAVVRYGHKYELEPELVLAVILVESGGRPWARSPKGAMGLMQVMPQHNIRLGLTGNAATIESNIEAGCEILAANISRLGEERGILTYFWGGDIRGDAYLERVQAARAEVRRWFDS
jgi:soluble lytic murein transglycosylase-like protein